MKDTETLVNFFQDTGIRCQSAYFKEKLYMTLDWKKDKIRKSLTVIVDPKSIKFLDY